jgi:hypothetical protein
MAVTARSRLLSYRLCGSCAICPGWIRCPAAAGIHPARQTQSGPHNPAARPAASRPRCGQRQHSPSGRKTSPGPTAAPVIGVGDRTPIHPVHIIRAAFSLHRVAKVEHRVRLHLPAVQPAISATVFQVDPGEYSAWLARLRKGAWQDGCCRSSSAVGSRSLLPGCGWGRSAARCRSQDRPAVPSSTTIEPARPCNAFSAARWIVLSMVRIRSLPVMGLLSMRFTCVSARSSPSSEWLYVQFQPGHTRADTRDISHHVRQ